MAKNLIWVGPGDGANSKPLHVEGIATEAGILPGSVLDYAAAGAGLELMDDAATVFGKPLLVADKDEGRSRPVTTAWTVDETMVGIRPRSGEVLHVRCVTGQALTPGVALVRSATPGALTIAAGDNTQEILCIADETITTTATELVRVVVA